MGQIWRLDEVDDDPRSRILTVRIVDRGAPFEVFFHVDPTELADIEQLVRQVQERPGYYHVRRPQVDPPRTLIRTVWQEGEDRVEIDNQGDSWMTVEARLGVQVYTLQFRLTPGEATRCAEVAQAAKASPRQYEFRPPRLRKPGEPRTLWNDSCAQWSLEEDDAGTPWLSVAVYEGLGASLARVRLSDSDAARCRKSRNATGKLADRIARSRGRYP